MITRLLRNSDSVAGGESSAGLAQSASPANVPVSDVRAEMFKGGPSHTPVKSVPMPPELKGKSLDLGDELMEYDGQADAHDMTVSKEFEGKVKEIKLEEGEKKEEKKEEEVKSEEKKEEVKTEEQKQEPKKFKAGLPEKPVFKQDVKKEVGARDYSWAPEEVREELKQTSNKSFAFIQEKYAELQAAQAELSKLKPELEAIEKQGYPRSWTEHPEAWRLHPGAQQAIARAERTQFEEQHWENQLELIEAGKPYYKILGYRQDGSVVYSEPIEASEEGKKIAIGNAARLQGEKQRIYVGINTFAQNFKQQYDGQMKVINDFIQDQWPWHNDAKHERQKDVKEFMSVIPDIVPNEVLKKVAGLMYASYQATVELLHEKKAEEKKQEVIKETVQAVEPRTSAPTPSSVNKGKRPNGVPATFDIEGM